MSSGFDAQEYVRQCMYDTLDAEMEWQLQNVATDADLERLNRLVRSQGHYAAYIRNPKTGAVIFTPDREAMIEEEVMSVKLHQTSQTPQTPQNANKVLEEPPWVAELLVAAVTSRKHREAILGDFSELFIRDKETMSLRRAQTRYWGQALHCVGARVWFFIKRITLLHFFGGFGGFGPLW